MKFSLFIAAIFIVSGIYITRPEISSVNNLQPTTDLSASLGTSNLSQVQAEEIPKEISVIISPEKIIQGEPVLVTATGTSSVESIIFEGKKLTIFEYGGNASVLIGIDLRKAPGRYPLVVTFSDGTVIKENIVVGKRKIVMEEFHIPEKLGGDTKKSEKQLVNTLIQEGVIINSIPTVNTKLWEGEFGYPVENINITDTYGYSRQTGGSAIPHKGTDFRATVGTPVYAMNSGVIRYTSLLRNYGHTVVVDHGLGVQTIYMHLSQVLVKNGDKVAKGELIAKSGDTGYTFGPHLHLSVKINKVSIDPIKFIELLGDR